MARIPSKGLMLGAAGAAIGAGRGAAGAGRGAAGAAPVAGRGAVGAGVADVLSAGAGAPAPAPVGIPGGKVGNLIVGAADGFGGKLMRTVSFFGWTLPVSFLGGTAPDGMLGISAITFNVNKTYRRRAEVSNPYSGFFFDQLPASAAQELLDKIG
jgi:hypothetical protein